MLKKVYGTLTNTHHKVNELVVTVKSQELLIVECLLYNMYYSFNSHEHILILILKQTVNDKHHYFHLTK